MTIQDWSNRLTKAFREKANRKGARVRLPASGMMTVTGEGDQAVVGLRVDAIVKNMQTNAAAFEGWCLVLKYWAEATRVTLTWHPPADPADRHYQRFLYRVDRFRSLFSDWFEVGRDNGLSASMVLTGKPLYLNVAGNRNPDAGLTCPR